MERCRYDQPAEDVQIIGEVETQPAEIRLCTWGTEHPASADKLLDAPRWLQRNAIAGHLMAQGDCLGCPGYCKA